MSRNTAEELIAIPEKERKNLKAVSTGGD